MEYILIRKLHLCKNTWLVSYYIENLCITNQTNCIFGQNRLVQNVKMKQAFV